MFALSQYGEMQIWYPEFYEFNGSKNVDLFRQLMTV